VGFNQDPKVLKHLLPFTKPVIFVNMLASIIAVHQRIAGYLAA